MNEQTRHITLTQTGENAWIGSEHTSIFLDDNSFLFTEQDKELGISIKMVNSAYVAEIKPTRISDKKEPQITISLIGTYTDVQTFQQKALPRLNALNENLTAIANLIEERYPHLHMPRPTD